MPLSLTQTLTHSHVKISATTCMRNKLWATVCLEQVYKKYAHILTCTAYMCKQTSIHPYKHTYIPLCKFSRDWGTVGILVKKRFKRDAPTAFVLMHTQPHTHLQRNSHVMESFKDTLFPHVLTYARTYVCVCLHVAIQFTTVASCLFTFFIFSKMKFLLAILELRLSEHLLRFHMHTDRLRCISSAHKYSNYIFWSKRELGSPLCDNRVLFALFAMLSSCIFFGVMIFFGLWLVWSCEYTCTSIHTYVCTSPSAYVHLCTYVPHTYVRTYILTMILVCMFRTKLGTGHYTTML